jgi:apolipoprotein N-acyltransferase
MRYAAALLSGLALASAFAPWDWATAVWIWPLPLFWALSQLPEPTKLLPSLRLGLLAGLGWSLPSFGWVRHSSRVMFGAVDHEWLGWGPELMGAGVALALALYLALYVAVWSWFVRCVAWPDRLRLQHSGWFTASVESLRSAGLAAASWVALEWLRGWLFTGFSWNGLGAGLVRHATLIQVADMVGSVGLAFTPVFAIIVVAITAWRIVLQKQAGRPLRWHFDVALTAGLIATQLIYGIQRLAEQPSDPVPVRIALVQQAIPQAERWSADAEMLSGHYKRYSELTQLYTAQREGSAVDLVVWPESAMLNFYSTGHEEFFNGLMALGNFSLLSGTDVLEPAGPSYVSAALFNKGWNGAQLYHKRHLVPFGEYLPIRWLPGMEAAFGDLFPGDFQHGPEVPPLQLLNVPGVELLPLVCFEDTVARVARRGVRAAPQLLINITNDAWFLASAEPQAHLANAVLRTVELRRPMVRACNTGVSAFITDRGAVTATLTDGNGDTQIQGVLPGTLVADRKAGMTFYARNGDAFAMAMTVLCALATAVKKKSRPS